MSAEAKLDYIGPGGRLRGNVLYLMSVPDRVRLAQPAVATREVEIDLAAIFRSSRAPIDLAAVAHSAVTSPHTTARR